MSEPATSLFCRPNVAPLWALHQLDFEGFKMAKVSGPLHSISASGTVGNTLTMLRQFQTNIAKKKGKPGGAPSAQQLARRAYYRQASADWMALTPLEKSAWKPGADAKQITPFNAYMSARLAAFASGAGLQWDGGTAQWDGGAAVWS
jgi:hypothetical protein